MNKLWFKEFRAKSASILQKFGRGLMLLIAILPFAGLLLGIGGAIFGANAGKFNVAAQTTAQVFKSMSDIVFANLPVLFCIAVVITFANDAGAAAFIGLLGFMVFQSSQTPFIHFVEGTNDKGEKIWIFKDIMWFHKS